MIFKLLEIKLKNKKRSVNRTCDFEVSKHVHLKISTLRILQKLEFNESDTYEDNKRFLWQGSISKKFQDHTF
jgi:hypothetical protein